MLKHLHPPARTRLWIGTGLFVLHCCLALSAAAQEAATANWDPSWVDARIAAWQPTQAERAFHKIGWVSNLTDAERLAQEHQRPLFLFTYDGTDLACFRC